MSKRVTGLNLATYIAKQEEESPKRALLCDVTKKSIEHYLTKRQREIIMLRFYNKRSVTEIAAQLSLNKSTVSRHIAAAQRRLEDVLQLFV